MLNPPPEHFYKYRSLSGEGLGFSEDIFAKNRLFWPSPRVFNDPFDCAPVPEFPQSKAARRQYAKGLVDRTGHDVSKLQRKATLKLMLADDLASIQSNASKIVHDRLADVGVCSFSEVPDDILMWSHYADSHRGICLRFTPTRFDWSHFLPHEVRYSRHRPTLMMSNQDMEAWARAALLTKAEQWAYEKEWRTFNIDGPGLHEFRPSMFDGVILGARIGDADRQSVTKWLENRQYSAAMRIYQAVFDDHDFALRLELR